MAKTEQLQLRVSAEEKERIKSLAALAGEDVSKWVLRRLLPRRCDEFQLLVTRLGASPSRRSLVLAELHDFLHALSSSQLEIAVQTTDLKELRTFESNYLAAMVEYACFKRDVPNPAWLQKIPPLAEPWFASELKSLRLHLLTSSPPPFRRRNLFVDSSLGARV